MITLIVLWMAIAVVLDRLLVVAPLDIKKLPKKALYYVVLAPYLVAVYAAQLIVNKTTWGAMLTDWFKS